MRTQGLFFSVMLLSGFLNAACSSGIESASSPSRVPPPGAQPQPPSAATCDATKAQWAVGERASSDLLERARVSAEASTARFIRPNQPITMEFLGWRLNLGLDAQDVVAQVSCG